MAFRILGFLLLSRVVAAKRPGQGHGHCTAMAWDAGATTEGHGLASQTDDGEGKEPDFQQ